MNDKPLSDERILEIYSEQTVKKDGGVLTFARAIKKAALASVKVQDTEAVNKLRHIIKAVSIQHRSFDPTRSMELLEEIEASFNRGSQP